jgi:dienelactone hydrolase
MDKAAWEARKLKIRAQLWALLGDMPPLFTPHVRIIKTMQHEGYRLEHFAFDNGADATVYGYMLIPDNLNTPAPAVLYCHLHGGKYHLGKEQIVTPLESSGYADGIELGRRGYIVLAIDAYAFGERQQQGPLGAEESGRETEHSLFKHFLWQGKTLWGMMVRDDLLALNYLITHPQVDSRRIGVTGMSLGGSRATWLSALDDRFKVTIPVAQMTRYADFAATGKYHHHSFYYYVPGALKAGFDMEHIVSLTAPRYQRILIGNADPLSPFSGVQTIETHTRQIYSLYDAAANFDSIIYDGIAHKYTPEMCRDMLAGFEQWL